MRFHLRSVQLITQPNPACFDSSDPTSNTAMALQSLSAAAQHSVSEHFDALPFRPEDKLKEDAALALFNELPTTLASKVSSFIGSELFYKRACSQMARLGCRVEEHGLSYKRMFFELSIQDLLSTTVLTPSIAENIFTLQLTSCLPDFPIDEICSQLQNLNSIDIKYEYVSGGSYTSRLERMPKALKVSTNLIRLTLQESFLNDIDIATMFDNDDETPCPSILNLNLRHNKITSVGLDVIVKHFIAPLTSVLTSLDLMGNCIDSEGGSIIGKGLETNESVLEVNLRLNNLGDEGGSYLFGSLHDNKTLRHLNLSGNSLGSHSAKALVTMFESNESTALETVVITCNSFTDDDEEAIKSCNNCKTIFDVRSTSGGPTSSFDVLRDGVLPF